MWAILGVPNTKLRHQYPGLVPCCDPVGFFDPRYLHATHLYIYILMIISATSLLLTLCLSFAVTSMNQSFTHLWTWIWLNMKDSPGFGGRHDHHPSV
jgi:hypothetical protein